jgi:hypothetical protein
VNEINTEKQLKKKIRQLIIAINKESNKSRGALNKDQKKLLQNVLYVHNRVEHGLNLMITVKLVQPISGRSSIGLMMGALKHVRMRNIIDDITFTRKLKIAKDFGLLSSPDIRLFTSLNDLRNDFAHFKFNNIKNDLDYYHESYRLLLEAKNLVTILVAKFLVEENMTVSPGEE